MKIFKILYYILIAFIGLVALLLIVSIFPITGNIKFMVVQSGSMSPAIRPGALLLVKPVDDYQIGDVITFGKITKTQSPISHRIFDVKVVEGETFYITKGDVNNAPDQKEVQKNDIIGKVLFDIPYLGLAVDFAKKPLGFALIIIVPAAVVIFDETKKIFKEIKKNKNQKT